MEKCQNPSQKPEIEKLRYRVEELKEAEGTLNYLLNDPDIIFRTDALIKVMKYKELRRKSETGRVKNKPVSDILKA